MIDRRRVQWLIALGATVTTAAVAPAVSPAAHGPTVDAGVVRAAAPIHPVLGDWEGRGPHGLRLSFALVRHHATVEVTNFALGLPLSCRTRGGSIWDAGEIARVEYLAPGTRLHGPFPPLGPHQFELFTPPTKAQPLPAPFLGSFSTTRAGAIDIPSWTQYRCHHHTAWPNTLRFALTATRRPRVADGLWQGSITAPAGMTGTVKVRVIDGGRIESDISVAYTCPPALGGGGSWRIGPLPTVGFLIAADGRIGGDPATESQWRGRFAHGTLTGTFQPPPCLSATGVRPRFSARPAAP